MAKDTVRIFTAPGCAPCEDIKEALEDGDVELIGVDTKASIEFVDLSTDEGYPYLDVLNMEKGPVAYYESRQCKLLVDDETGRLSIDCREADTADSQEAPGQESRGASPS